MRVRPSRLNVGLPNPTFAYIPFGAGLDTTSSPIETAPGSLKDSKNYEITVNGGYRGIDGYERFDGQARPSDASYIVIDCTISGSIVAGNTVTGQSSGASGVCVYVNTTYDATQAHIVLTKVTGTFTNGENLQVSAVTQAVADSPQKSSGPTSQLSAQYKNYAADEYRGDIAAVPGSGDVLGICMIGDTKYAFRNNAGGTACDVYKNTAAGWTQVSLGYSMNFTSGGTEYATGSVQLTGGGSGSVDGITVNGVQIMSGAEAYATDLNTTAQNVVDNINAHTSEPNYTATRSGSTITITADDGGTGPNGYTVTSSTTTITTTDTNMSGGASATAIAIGDLVTGETSTQTGTVTKVLLESGSWQAGTAAGKIIFKTDPGGAFTASETLKVGSDLNKCTVTASYSAITLLPDGQFQFTYYNFGGAAGSLQAYGCDGVNQGFEFDGNVLAKISTGMTTDVPTNVAVFNGHLFFSFAGSAQHSSTGTPYMWDPVTGAAELAVGDTITAFLEQPGASGGGALAIFSRNSIHVLYGTSILDWNLVRYRSEVGAYQRSVQEFGTTLMLDDRGIVSLNTAQEFGNFRHDSLSDLVKSWLDERKTTITASTINRDKSQYRIFFSDGSGLYVTMKRNQVRGFMPVLFSDVVKCCVSRENSSGTEEIYFGSAGGMVYQMDKGTSFDGDNVERYLVLHYFHNKAPRLLKKYLDATMELQGSGYADFQFSWECDYTDTIERSQQSARTLTANYSSVYWDSFTWDDFYWDGRVLSPTHEKLTGSGENISFVIRSDSDYHNPLTFSGIQMRYYNRRNMR